LESPKAKGLRTEAKKEYLRMKKANLLSGLAYTKRIMNILEIFLITFKKSINKGIGATF